MRRNWWMFSLLTVLVLFANVCEAQGQSFTQWAVTASASSEYGSGSWSAQQLVGQPNVYPYYGDNGQAWAPGSMNNGLQWVELGFLEAVYVERVEIYETFNPGAIVKVELVDPTGGSHPIWEGEGGPAEAAAKVFSVTNSSVTIPCKGVRITLDTDTVAGWNEIDAVSITGSYNSPWSQAQADSDMVVQWASGAKASSQYREDRWTPEHMTGRPDVYPKYGDYDTAWVASSSDGGEEWAELFYDEAVYVKRIDVYETYNPGAIVKVEIMGETGKAYVVWEGKAQAAPEKSRIFSIDNINVDIPARHVRIVLQTDQVPGWNEIDAVCLVGMRTTMEEAKVMGSLEQLASIILRLGGAVERGKEERLADSVFLQELEEIVRELSNIGF
ncbi:MAG: hypothetical protein GX249_12695 [Firmicutes bacterium]|nr:hypothetical protein [Bacillota bacterium]